MNTPPKPKHRPASLDLALLRGAVEEVPLGVATTRGGEILSANGALERIFGAPPNGLERRKIDDLFDAASLAKMREELTTTRVFDGRVTTRGVDGREVIAEVHAERYTSSTDGIGGFLIVRDVSFELGALARLIDLVGGALFRIRARNPSLEHVSPSIEQVTGLSAARCLAKPDLLLERVDAPERERLVAGFKRLIRGDAATGTMEVSFTRPDGTRVLLQVRATGRRDTSNAVTHVEGVVTDVSAAVEPRAQAAERDTERSSLESSRPGSALERRSSRPPYSRRFDAPAALVDVSRVLLQEATSLLGDATSEVGTLRTMISSLASSVPPNVQRELASACSTMSARLSAVSALQRRVRRAMDGRASAGPLVNVLESVRMSMAPIVGEHAVTVNAGDAGHVLLERGLDELTLALLYFSLRAFRLGGSGQLRVDAAHWRPAAHDIRTGRAVAIHIVGEPAADNTMTAADPGSGLVATIPRHSDMLSAFEGAGALLEAVGGKIEADEVTVEAARTSVRLAF